MRILPVALVLTLISATAVLAQNTAVIKERQDHLEAMGKAAKEPGKMFKGEEDFDLDKVKAALARFQEKGALLPRLFPDDSKTGEDTEALPAIWENKADFEGRYPKLVEAAKAAATAITDEVTFQDEWPKVMDNCKECHKKYRKQQK
jgi:cytochrome c556